MIELYLVKPNEMIEIPTDSITWSGQRYKAARKIEANVLYTNQGGLQYTKVEEGNTVLFKWKGKELFRGTIFSRNKTKSGLLSFTAYDMLQYLLVNKDVYVFSKRRADQIIVRLCKDFQIPYGAIANTGVVLNEIHQNETTLYDIALRALINTEKQNGRRFQITSQKGKLKLNEWKPSSDQWVLETGVNLIDYNYSTSIEETATRVKLISGDEKNTVTVTVSDSSGQKRYGVLQHFERVNEKLNKGQLTKRGQTILNKKKGVQKELEVEALGIAEIISGKPIYVIEKEIGIKGTHYVDEDTHSFKGEHHHMQLKLIQKNTRAEVD
ncbi:XkdQ/YqbQ family protein [Siminovitchia terrae]|uniref:XkdQ/YqbQ family protein n=1 Tax=Siminovitchia terrae TaxID=1914933 RepID=UPI0028AC6B7B|nr:phage portal protein [Siminovitchia terrae]